jgi:hypothetical protein
LINLIGLPCEQTPSLTRTIITSLLELDTRARFILYLLYHITTFANNNTNRSSWNGNL